MSDGIFLRLNDKLALGADDLQWILYAKARADAALDRPRDWHPVSFVHSTKAILLSRIGSYGELYAEAQLALESLPDTFDAWKAAKTRCRGALEPV